MGRLVHIEVENFKSYEGKQIIGPFSDFTCIIGPNGSGKSNLMDAISFVLGVKSSHLRSFNLKELLHRNCFAPDGRKNEEGTAATATVKLLYKNASDELVSFKRSINKSGTSEYFINDETVSFADYTKFLEAEDILVKARNFLVFQGDIEAVASQSPIELTRLIEQISGSDQYVHEYARLKAEYEQAVEQSSVNFSKKRGVTMEMKQFKEQKKEIERYEVLVKEKELLTITHLLWKLYHIEKNLSLSQSEIEGGKGQLEKEKSSMAVLNADLKDCRLQLAKHHNMRLKLEKVSIKLSKSVDAQKPKLVKVCEEIGFLERKERNDCKSREKLTQELGEHEKCITALNKQISDLEKARQRFFNEKNSCSRGRFSLTNEQEEEYKRLRAQLDSVLILEKSELDKLSREINLKEETIELGKEKLSEVVLRRSQVETEVKSVQALQQKLEGSVQELDKDINITEKDAKETILKRKRIEKAEKEAEEKLIEVYSRLDEVKYKSNVNRKNSKLNDALSSLKKAYPGVYGRLVDLCKPADKKYERPLSLVLGKHMDSIVVESKLIAIQCIKYLKENEVGLATILPLDELFPKNICEKLRSLGGNGARLAIDLILFDPMYSKAFSYICGNAVICDSLDIARHLCFEKGERLKAVTLDGSVIHKGGMISGGTTQNIADCSRRWQQKSVEELNVLRINLEENLKAFEKERKSLVSEELSKQRLESLLQQRLYITDDQKVNKRKLASLVEEFDHHSSTITNLQTIIARGEAELQSLKREMKKLDSVVMKKENEMFSDFCQCLKLSSIKEFESDKTESDKVVEEKRLQFDDQISLLNNQAEFQKVLLEKTRNQLKLVDERLLQFKSQLEPLQIQKVELLASSNQTQKEVDDTKINLLKAMSEEKEYESSCRLLKNKIKEMESQLDKRLTEISSQDSFVETLIMQKKDLIRKCVVENIDIPFVACQNRNEEKEIDFSELDDDLKNDSSTTVEHQFIGKIEQLENEVERLAPNIKAIERIDGMEIRLKKTLDEFELAREKAREIKDKFQMIRQKRIHSFQMAFDHIAKMIDEIYKELTKTETHPLGGTAFLTLENSEEPYLDGVKFHVMPPMKRFRDMEQLSGGEKTVAALALLFAIHSYRASPFFVLDEVDAALDNTNITQLAEYIRTHAGSSVQFVVISLKSSFYEKSDSLVGVYRNRCANSSRVLTLDLLNYQNP